ncbi:MAG TPA: peptidoglycan-binding protein [Candidatus Limiplasma sp.]|nr:peptidoglycan-binding protein [Candidatus Limiplasma sp.]
MRTRLQRWTALVCGILLAVSAVITASAATYPYDTLSADSVNLRKYASQSSTIIAYIQKGDAVTVLGESGTYYKVKFGDVTGYAVAKYINGDSLLEDPEYIVNQLSSVSKYPYQTATTESTVMRKTASATATAVLTIPKNAIITVSAVYASRYAKVSYNGKTGYILSDSFVLAPIPTPSPIPEPTLNPNAEKYTQLSNGDSGTFVTALQEALKELQFYKAEIDGKYGPATQSAVELFEKRNGLTIDGIADPGLLYLIFEGKPKNYSGYRKDVSIVPPVYGISLKYGDKGDLVKQLQTRLQTLGYYEGTISGTFGSSTQSALKAFQKKMSIAVDGIATTDVQTILYSASARSATDLLVPTPVPTATLQPPAGTVRMGNSGNDVQLVQTRLYTLGYYTGKIDGKFGSGTFDAVSLFQEVNSLTVDGICGSATIAVLFSNDALYNGSAPTPAPTQKVVITEDNVTTVEIGSIGNAVLSVQTKLFELGYYISRLDGVFLEEDEAAVKLFQKVNGLTSDGKAGYETLKLLFSDDAKAAPVSASDEEDTYATLRYGDNSSEVATMQSRLIELGYLSGTADGKFGLQTKAALIAFQRENGLVRDGIAGNATLTALYATEATVMDTTQVLKEGMASTTVRQMQEHLIALGYLSGNADGKFGPLTSLALLSFQKAQRLTADGIAGTLTLSALIKEAQKKSEAEVAATAPSLSGGINPANVKYANWYDEIRAVAKKYPNVTVYDFNTGISWHVTLFSLGAHADGYPTTAADTEKLYQAFGNEVTWTPKPVWVVFSNGAVYMASTHDTAHGVDQNLTNNFPGHLCIHFPRTADQVAAIGPYATSHQKAIDLGWTATVAKTLQ